MNNSLEHVQDMITERIDAISRGTRRESEVEFLIWIQKVLQNPQVSLEAPYRVHPNHVDEIIEYLLSEDSDLQRFLMIKKVREAIYSHCANIMRRDGVYTCPLSHKSYYDYRNVIQSVVAGVILETRERQEEWFQKSQQYTMKRVK